MSHPPPLDQNLQNIDICLNMSESWPNRLALVEVGLVSDTYADYHASGAVHGYGKSSEPLPLRLGSAI